MIKGQRLENIVTNIIGSSPKPNQRRAKGINDVEGIGFAMVTYVSRICLNLLDKDAIEDADKDNAEPIAKPASSNLNVTELASSSL